MNNQQKDKVAKILKDAQEAPDDEIVEIPAEEIEEEPKEAPKETPADDNQPDQPQEEETPVEEEQGDEPKEEPKREEPKKPLPKPEDRLVESQKEAYVLQQKNKKLNDAIEQAANLPEPTEEELKQAYPSWDTMDDSLKQLAKDNLINKRRFALIDQQRIEGKKIEEWAGKVDEFLTMDAGKSIPDEQADRFRSFCMKPTRRGLDFEDLRAAFLYSSEVATPRTQHKGSLFNTANGGGNGPKEKPKELTAEEVQTLRATDPKRYKKLIKEGKINLV